MVNIPPTVEERISAHAALLADPRTFDRALSRAGLPPAGPAQVTAAPALSVRAQLLLHVSQAALVPAALAAQAAQAASGAYQGAVSALLPGAAVDTSEPPMVVPWDRTPPQSPPGLLAVVSADFACPPCFPSVPCLVPGTVEAQAGARPRCGSCPRGFAGASPRIFFLPPSQTLSHRSRARDAAAMRAAPSRPPPAGDGVSCTDVNECLAQPGPCYPGVECRNAPGTFSCGAQPCGRPPLPTR